MYRKYIRNKSKVKKNRINSYKEKEIYEWILNKIVLQTYMFSYRKSINSIIHN